MSRIKQLAREATSDVRKSSAEAKASTANPKDLSNSGSDSRTDSSSSTTHRSGWPAIEDSIWENETLGNIWCCSDIHTRLVRTLPIAGNSHLRPGNGEDKRRARPVVRL